MNKWVFIILIIVKVILSCNLVQGQDEKVFVLHENKEIRLPLSYLSFNADTSAQYQITDFIDSERYGFKNYADKEIKFESEVVYWAKLSVKSILPNDSEWVFYPHGQGNPTSVDVFIQSDKNSNLQHKKSGYKYTLPEKDIPEIRNGKIKLFIKSGETQTLYIRLETRDGYQPKFIPILQPWHTFENIIDNRNLMQGFFQGIMWIMLLYNLIVFLTSRDIVYLHYSFYVLFITLYFAHFHGLSEEVVFVNSPLINKQLIMGASLGAIFYFTFLRAFLHTKTFLPKWDWIIKSVIGVCVFLFGLQIIFSISKNYFMMVRLMNISVLIECVFSFVFIGVLIRTKDKKAMYFVLGSILLWIMAPIGVTAYMLFDNKGIVPIVQVGLVMEILLFALGLGYRVRANEKEKRKAQDDLITQLKTNDELQTKVNKELEVKVKERTEALETQKEELAYQKEEILAQRDLVERQKEYLEKANNQIKSSINYAQRIQDAILPPIDKIKDIMPEVFVFFKPRDVVSGDFYWFGKKNGKIIIAAVDCTGHGVPGGFMSMISHSLLNQIILDKGVLKPGEILDRLNIGVWKALKQSETKNKDGMDMSLVVIDSENKKMEVACAKNPFLYIQQNGKGPINHVIKGDKMSVGGWSRQKIKRFTTHTIDLNMPTTFYMYSDGFQDQFGGKEGTKFFAKRFRDLLTNSYQLPLEEQQKNLEQSLFDWMRDTGKLFPERQVDDILVIGAKVGC